MGESKIRYFSSTHVVVFWNLEDYPITSSSSANLRSIYDNIGSALDKMGCFGNLQVGMFGVELDDIEPPNKPHIFYEPCRVLEGESIVEHREVGENAADWNMALNILAWVQVESDIVVLAKKKPESEVFRVLRIIKKPPLKLNVFLLEPPPDSTAEDLFRSVDSIVESTQRF